uniref:Uncharacterized protein n=1 Tax=Sphaerodactylus townsendi TaxID=933632 RepID=A0ACB8FGK9_9SAUR
MRKVSDMKARTDLRTEWVNLLCSTFHTPSAFMTFVYFILTITFRGLVVYYPHFTGGSGEYRVRCQIHTSLETALWQSLYVPDCLVHPGKSSCPVIAQDPMWHRIHPGEHKFWLR